VQLFIISEFYEKKSVRRGSVVSTVARQRTGQAMYLRWIPGRNKRIFQSSCLHRASKVSKTLFIVPTDAHYYRIIEMLKQFKKL